MKYCFFLFLALSLLSCSSQNNNYSDNVSQSQDNVRPVISKEEANKAFKDLYLGMPKDSTEILGYAGYKYTPSSYELNDSLFCGVSFNSAGMLFFEDKLYDVYFFMETTTPVYYANLVKDVIISKYGNPDSCLPDDTVFGEEITEFYSWQIHNKKICSAIQNIGSGKYGLSLSISDVILAEKREADRKDRLSKQI